MTKEKVQLIAGGLLHDVGKVIYRQGNGRKHSVSGYEFLKQEAGLEEKNVLESVRYHMGSGIFELYSGSSGGKRKLYPSSTAKDELADISLYDHMKLTAACNACIYDYLQENGITDYKDRLLVHGEEFQREKIFALFSMDISGIQNSHLFRRWSLLHFNGKYEKNQTDHCGV